MNCKQGDLAIVVRSTHGNEGKIVECRIFHPFLMGKPDWWELDLKTPDGRTYAVRDAWLRPLRDNDGPDETLAWVPSPSLTHAN